MMRASRIFWEAVLSPTLFYHFMSYTRIISFSSPSPSYYILRLFFLSSSQTLSSFGSSLQVMLPHMILSLLSISAHSLLLDLLFLIQHLYILFQGSHTRFWFKLVDDSTRVSFNWALVFVLYTLITLQQILILENLE